MPNPTKKPVKGINPIIDFIVSCYFWFSLFSLSAILFPVSISLYILTVAFDKRRYIMHKWTCVWSAIILSINPYWKVRVEGRNKIDPKKIYVMVSNHQSGADILVLFLLFNHFKWVAKKELFYMPFIGWNMWLNGYIPIERSRGRSKLQMMDNAALAIRGKNSVILFPEGTRSKDGQLQAFKSGAFRLALETGCDILPVVLKGTHYAIKKGGLTIHRNKNIKAIVLDPLPFETFMNLDSKEAATKVHDIILNELLK